MKLSLLKNLPASLPEEVIETLCASGTVRIERIISRGQASPAGFWYDQEQDEFVLVLQGRAGLALEGQAEVMVLEPGECLEIKAHVKHRVEWTAPEQETIWLAVYY
jgi:cupin 2 domain-containing protein